MNLDPKLLMPKPQQPPAAPPKRRASRLKDWSDQDFAPEVLQAEIQSAHPTAAWVLYAIVAFFTIALLWAAFARIDEAARGEGKVIPSSQVQLIQNLEGGILKKINVHEGDIVEAGQVIMEIDDTSLSSSLGELRAKMFGAQAKVARLTAETQGAPLAFPPYLLAEARDAASAESDLMRAREDALETQISILRQQLDQRQQELTELKTKIEQSQNNLALAQQELNITEPLAASGVVSKVQVLRLRRDIATLKGDIANSQAAIPRAESAIREANQRISEKYRSFRADAGKELVEAQTQLAGIEEVLKGAQDKVARTEVRSLVRGVVKTLNVTTIGGVIKPGMDMAEIVPLDDTLLVEAKITPRDVAFLRPGQDAMVKFTAYDSSIYGGLKGKLERISADALIDPNDRNNTAYFKIVVKTDKNYLEHDGKHLPIMPGMIANVDILTGSRTILDYLMKPILKTRERALRER
ncbi:HlyD family type I secretion periplasmic adaptor subunit [Pseudomonas sp.]|uniref:HlyD family type I secretion periplasmic adaptor subunit n=1 Tax=Pseudomonas sp. TaxID=306 RepID=UPI003D134454